MATELYLKTIHDDLIDDLPAWKPASLEDAYVNLAMAIGDRNGGEGINYFYVLVSTPEALRKRHTGEVLVENRTIILSEYSYSGVLKIINSILEKASRDTWEESCAVLQRYFDWEFEDIVHYEDDELEEFVLEEQKTLRERHFKVEWTDAGDDEPTTIFDEVDPDGAVIRVVQEYADGRVTWDSLEDEPSPSPDGAIRANLIDGNFDDLLRQHQSGTPAKGELNAVQITRIDHLEFEAEFAMARSRGKRAAGA